jgi:hypothetical protein
VWDGFHGVFAPAKAGADIVSRLADANRSVDSAYGSAELLGTARYRMMGCRELERGDRHLAGREVLAGSAPHRRKW